MKLTHLLSSGLYRWSRSFTESATIVVRGLYRQWGITPRPEDAVQLSDTSIHKGEKKARENLSDKCSIKGLTRSGPFSILEKTEGERALDRYGIEQTCCFTGHRPEKLPWRGEEEDPGCLSLKKRLADTLESLYGREYRHFISGMARGADTYFAEAVLALKERRPGVLLEAAIPCPTQAHAWRASERARWRSILDRCDLETVVQQHYDRSCMLRRNRYMVEHSSILVAAYDGMGGGTMYTISYAMDCGLEIVNLPLQEPGIQPPFAQA